MPYPLVAVAGPLLLALLVLLIGRRGRRGPLLAGILGGLGALILRILLAAQPLIADPGTGREIAGGAYSLLGRELVMGSPHHTFLLFLYSTAAVLFLLSALWPQGAEFVPAGLALLATTAAALMMPQLSFGLALLLVIIGLAAILLASGRVGNSHGPRWYLLFTGLGVPFCLLAAWMLSTKPGAWYGSIWRLLLVGLLLLLAGFPFLFWVRPVFRISAPFPTVFVLSLVPLVMLLFIEPLLALSPAVWPDSPLPTLLGQAGAIMAGIAIALLIFTREWSGLLAYTLLADLGAVFIALSLGPAGLPVVGTLLLLRGMSLLLGGLGMKLLQPALPHRLPGDPPPDYQTGVGLAWKQPLGALLFLLGILSLAGWPLTPGFSGRWQLLTLLWAESLPFALLLILAMLSSLIGVVRAGRYLFARSGQQPSSVRAYWTGLKPPALLAHIVLLLLLVLSLFITFFPQLLLHNALN
jgi:formate hydrogenlyase subunit 3/multisubunit Na+/H+ antiporter MnhD subunit